MEFVITYKGGEKYSLDVSNWNDEQLIGLIPNINQGIKGDNTWFFGANREVAIKFRDIESLEIKVK